MTRIATETTTDPAPPRWLHAWAIVTAVVALLPIFLGAEVTSTGSGMVDPDGFTHLRNPLILPQEWFAGTALERGLAWVIEHGHRLAGILIGLCTILLALGLWLRGGRLRWLGPVALAAVVAQGMLGIFRVHLHAILGPNLALIHGCSAQLVFGLLVCIAVVTSPGWHLSPSDDYPPRPPLIKGGRKGGSPRLRRLALALPTLIYVQLVLGAFVRHTGSPLASRLHVLTAFLVVAGVVWLVWQWLSDRAGSVSDGRRIVAYASGSDRRSGVSKALGALVFALGLQLFLGVEALLSKFRVTDRLTHEQLVPVLDPSLIRSLHYVGGALVFGASLMVTLLICRPGHSTQHEETSTPIAEHELEGVA